MEEGRKLTVKQVVAAVRVIPEHYQTEVVASVHGDQQVHETWEGVACPDYWLR